MTRCRWLLGVRCQLLGCAGGGAAADKISQARRTPQPQPCPGREMSRKEGGVEGSMVAGEGGSRTQDSVLPVLDVFY